MDQDTMKHLDAELAHAGEETTLSPLMLQLEQLRITPDRELPPMDFLFRLFDKPCFPRHELVGITGKAKSGKTFLTSMLIACCQTSDILALHRSQPLPLRVLWYDTEQSDESTQDILKNRIMRLQTHPRPLPEWRGVDTSTSKSIYAPPSQGGGGGGSVCIVEAEKTAVIMSAIRPEYLWLATGGKTELSVARLSPLQGRRIILFPDTDETGQTYRDWYAIAEAAASVFDHPVTVSSILEQRATPAQRTAKIDIADLIYNE